MAWIERARMYGVPFVSKFSDKKFTYLLLKMGKNQRFVNRELRYIKSATSIY